MWGLAAAVVALQIPYPLVHGDARNVLTVVTVVVFAAASTVHAVVVDGVRAAAALLAVTLGIGFGAEVLGVHTGAPFGDYRYTGGLGPSLLGVPVVIPLAWSMMTRPSVLVAAHVARTRRTQLAVAAVALASWDVFLDPQMVDAHHWRWSHPSPHLPGVDSVPLSNFGGWLLVAVVLMAVLLVTRALHPRHVDTGRDRPMLALWVWSWLSSTLANLAFFGRPAVAAWGAAAMGLVGVPLVLRPLR